MIIGSLILLSVTVSELARANAPIFEQGYPFYLTLYSTPGAAGQALCQYAGWFYNHVEELAGGSYQIYCTHPNSTGEIGPGNPMGYTGFSTYYYEWYVDTYDITLPNTNPPPCSTVGNPIHPVTGCKLYSEEYPTSPALPFKQYYSSHNKDARGLGVGWSHTYSRSLVHSINVPVPTGALPTPETPRYGDAVSACAAAWNQLRNSLGLPITVAQLLPDGHCSIRSGGASSGQVVTITVVRPYRYWISDIALPPFWYIGTIPEVLKFTRHNGSVLELRKLSGIWYNTSGHVERVEEVTDISNTQIGWRYYTHDDEIETYDLNGRLLTLQTPQGTTQTLSYSGNGRLVRVDTTTGESIVFAYGANGQVETMTDHTGRVWGYQYTANGSLQYINNPDATTKQFHYENATFPHAMTGITDERGIRYATYEYDSKGRATSSRHAGNVDRVDIVYNVDGTRTVTNSRGGVSTYTSTLVNGVAAVSQIVGPGCETCGETDTSFVADASNNLIAKVKAGITTQWGGYDNKGNPGFMTEAVATPQERRTDYTYDTRYHSKVATTTEPSVFASGNKVTTHTYDDYGNKLNTTINGYKPDGTPVSRTTAYLYNGPLNQLSSIDGPRIDVSDVTTIDYYLDDPAEGTNRARIERITGPEGIMIRDNIEYSATGKILSETRPNNLTVTYDYYTGNDRLESVTESSGFISRTTRWTYLPSGEVGSITLNYGTPQATTLTLGYDDARRLTSITDWLGNSIEYTLDTEGNTEREDINNAASVLKQTLSQTFDLYSRLKTKVGSTGQTTTHTYNAAGNRVSTKDALNKTTGFDYDALNRLTQTTDALSGISQYDYNSQDQLTSVTDPNGNATDYTYDDLGNLLQLDSPDTGITTYSYDKAGNVVSQTDAKGNTTAYQYDALNRLVLITYQDSTTTRYDYDTGTNGIGRLSSVTDPTGTTQWTYDAFGGVTQKQQVTNGVTLTTSYQYDSAGRITQMTYPSGTIVDYTYTSGQLTRIEVNGQPLLTNIQYQPFGPPTGWTWGNGTLHTRSYDQDGQLTQHSINTGTRLLTYDDIGRITAINDPVNNLGFGYDDLSRLTSATGGPVNQGFSYDANGNRLGLTAGLNIDTYSYGASNNRLLNITGANPKTYTYDANGNITGDGSHTYTYDARNRMTGADGDYIYKINGLGQRVSKQGISTSTLPGDADGNGTIDTADFNRVIGLILQTTTATGTPDCNQDSQINVQDLVCINNRINAGQTTSTVTTLFTYDEQGQLMGEYNGTGTSKQETIYFNNIPVVTVQNNQMYYIHADHLNTPRAISDTTSTVLWRWDSTPFGETVPNEDPDNNTTTFTYNLRFPGQYYDQETGLHYNYFRDYSPATGRYVQSDPIGFDGGDLNLYAYVWNDPLNANDILGLAGEPFNRPGPIDQTGRTGRTGNPITGPYKNPKYELKVKILKKILDQLAKMGTGLGGLVSKSPAALGFSGLIHSDKLNENEDKKLDRIREELERQQNEKSICS